MHHLAGHIESIFLEHGAIPLPAAILVVSGGHTSLYVVPEPGVYRLVGRTRDDAAGEAYDKVARLLGLGYPGGPVVDRRAKDGNDQAVALPRPIHARDGSPPDDRRAADGPHLAEFSFSGLKTAVMRQLQQRGVVPGPEQGVPADAAAVGRRGRRLLRQLSARRRRDAGRPDVRAARRLGARSVGIAGGVSANSRLRRDATARGEPKACRSSCRRLRCRPTTPR